MAESLANPSTLNTVAAIHSPAPEPPLSVIAARKSRTTTNPETSNPGDESPEVSESVTKVLTSQSAVSFYSSATIHICAWGVAILVCHLFGLHKAPPTDSNDANIQASLGEEDILDDSARFDFVGEIGPVLELPSNGLDQIGQQLRKSDQNRLSGATGDIFNQLQNATTDGEQGGEQGGGTGVLLRVPASGLAVTKGSFTAFTIPAKPKPRESYSIVIEVRLTDDIRKYRVSDLSGEVKGSDNYVQQLPFDRRAPMASGYPVENNKIKPLTLSTILDVEDNRVQIIIKVPGAGRLVRDEIRIRSRRLREEQELTLIFGESEEPPVEMRLDKENTKGASSDK